jgi:hypothetical protein
MSETLEQVIQQAADATMLVRATHHIAIARLIEAAPKRETLAAYAAVTTALDAALEQIWHGYDYVIANDPELTPESNERMLASTHKFISEWSDKLRELENCITRVGVVAADNGWMH